ncbi:YmL10 [Tilletia horrida]|nr:YmL10 [Tilletia horrida]
MSGSLFYQVGAKMRSMLVIRTAAQAVAAASSSAASSSAGPRLAAAFSSLSLSGSAASRVLAPSSSLSPAAASSAMQTRGYAVHPRRGLPTNPRFGPAKLGQLKPSQPPKTRRRLGRGPSSGRGGTSTRGHKGQKARAGNGKPTPGFAGGQTPLMRLFPKRGFISTHGREYIPVNLDRIQNWIDQGRLDPSQPITAYHLLHSRCVHKVRDGIKILGDGAHHLRTPINLIVSRASQKAIAAIEGTGGSVECRYYNASALRRLCYPHKFGSLNVAGKGNAEAVSPDPISKKDILWYSSPRNRGYLALRAAAGVSPSSAPATASETQTK